ncbi:MAG TPA: choice-of-anchor D domain-containing protein, partial [Ilumatobacteraceae bacterium]
MMTLARPHWKSAIAVAVLLMCTVVVVTRDTVTHSATPPAEFVSVGFSPYQADNPSISADGGLVAYDYQNDTENDLNVRNRSVPNTETLTPFGTARAYPYDLQISRDGCQTVWTQDVAVTPESSANRAAIIAQNRCTGAAPVELYLGSDVQSTSGFSSLSISTRGRYVAFNDYSAHTVIRLDRDTNANGVLDDSTQAVATTPAGDLAQDPSLGDDAISGKMSLTAQVTGSKLYEIYVWDPSNPAAPLLLVSSAEGSTTDPVPYQSITSAMTPDARYVVFDMVLRIVTGKTATNIDQIVVRDTVTNHNAIISRDANGNYANGRSVQPSISADGTQIAFGTLSNNIPIVPAVGGVIGANNEGSFDLLVARSLTGYFDTLTYDRVSLKPDGTPVDTTHPFQGRQYMDIPRISANGRWVAFGSSYNDELQNGGTSSANSADLAPEVYVIGRPTAVSGSAVSFGSVNVGATTAAKLVTITNTGISSFLPARISTTGNFTAVGGGTCTINVYLSPGQSCTVAVRFKPTAAGARSGVLTVAETGFGAISAAVK